MCKADKPSGSNYDKPHVFVVGMYDHSPRNSCLYCGQWEGDNEADTRRSTGDGRDCSTPSV